MEKKRGPWTLLSSRVVYQNPWMTVREDAVRTPSGREGTYGTVSCGDGAIILPLDSHGNIYLAKEYRYGLDKTVVEVFAGGIDENESPLAGAKRELREEAGITAQKWTYFGGFSIYSSKMPSIDHLFLAEELSFGPQELEDTETIQVVTMPLAEALDALARNEIMSMQSAALILQVERELARRKLG